MQNEKNIFKSIVYEEYHYDNSNHLSLILLTEKDASNSTTFDFILTQDTNY
jgi:hypothetical protein